MLYERSTHQPQLIVTLNVAELESLIRKSVTDAINAGFNKRPEAGENPVDEPLLSIDELCAKLGVSRDLIYRLRKEGRINGYIVGKRKFFKFSEVLRQCKTKGR